MIIKKNKITNKSTDLNLISIGSDEIKLVNNIKSIRFKKTIIKPKIKSFLNY